ncbi:MAG TPA: MATE family efflux transporter [Gemmatimonadaceae bacterium]|nr:MATE family efflux transporter [Gemmatimonadaceae bacterium]
MSDLPIPRSFRAELRAMVQLALPIVVVQVGIQMMGVVDTVMVGRLTARDLAGVALGNMYFFAVCVFGMGVLMALDPIVAQAVGARDKPAIARGMQRAFLLAVVLSILSSLLLLTAAPVMRLFRQPVDVVPIAAQYAWVMIPGLLPFYAFIVLRQALQAMHRVRPIVITIIGANIANVWFNWVLIFGNLGFPSLGTVGAAWATSLSRALMAGALLAICWRELRQYLLPIRHDTLAGRPIWRMLRLGAPIGAQMQLEFGVFGLVALLMGWLGTAEMAAHQVAINLASVTFMVPLGVSAAAAVLVGQAVGRGDQVEARRAGWAALLLGGAFMLITAALMLWIPDGFAALYTTQTAVAAIAATLIPLAGVFQVFDGLQVVAIGVLRGVGDTRAPLIINILGFWLIGLPVSLYLGFVAQRGPEGLWWGLVVGLAVVAVILLVRVRSRLARDLRRLVIDDHASDELMAELTA